MERRTVPVKLTVAIGVPLLLSSLLLAGAARAARSGNDVIHIGAMPYGGPRLGKPHAPARMTATQAIQAAAKVWGSAVFTQYPHTVRYGSYHSSTMLRTPSGPQPVGTVDAWLITVTGLDLPRPAAEVAGQNGSLQAVVGPNIHTWIIVVDDKVGKYLEEIEF